MVPPPERSQNIRRELARWVSPKRLRVNKDEQLNRLVGSLNEFPQLNLGSFVPSYLALPEEILITVMRDHQKYFAVRRRDGELAPHFLAVINLNRYSKG